MQERSGFEQPVPLPLQQDAACGGYDRSRREVRWHRVGAFLGLTFAVSWGGNLLFWLTGAYQNHSAALALLGWQMWVPAACAIALQTFVFVDDPPQRRALRPWFFRAFLLAAVISTSIAISTAYGLVTAGIAHGTSAVLHIVLLLVLLGSRSPHQQDALARFGLSFGRQRYWLWFALSYLGFAGLQLAFLLTTRVGGPQPGVLESRGPEALTSLVLFSLIISPILALAGTALGEEYGWRGFLQCELLALGARRGVLLVGLIWAVWHYPIVMLGLHSYPANAIGVALMTLICVLHAFVLGYARIKSDSVWLPAYLHMLGNALAGTLFAIAPLADIVVSFGIGLAGLACLAVVVALILRDPLWRSAPVREETSRIQASPADGGE